MFHCSVTKTIALSANNLLKGGWLTHSLLARLGIVLSKVIQKWSPYIREYFRTVHHAIVNLLQRGFSVAYPMTIPLFTLIISVCAGMTLFLADCPLTLLALQCEKATPRGEDCQHLPEGPADETETERFGEETRELALLEAHPAQHRRRGGRGRRPVCVLDVLPMKHCGSLRNRLLFCTSTWRKVLL